MHGRCCSDTFARSLTRQLRKVGRYRPSSHGIYTDTAEYTGIIGECTNLSVGYDCEHSTHESVDYWHALKLCHALMRLDEDKLVCERTPDEDEDYRYDALVEEDTDEAYYAEIYGRYSWEAPLSDEDKRTLRLIYKR